MLKSLLLPFPLPQDYCLDVIKVLLKKAGIHLSEALEANPTSPDYSNTVSISELAHAVYLKTDKALEARLLLLKFYSSPEILAIRPRLPSPHQHLLVERLAESIDIQLPDLNRISEANYIECWNRVTDDCKGWTRVSINYSLIQPRFLL